MWICLSKGYNMVMTKSFVSCNFWISPKVKIYPHLVMSTPSMQYLSLIWLTLAFMTKARSSRPGVFFWKGVLKICSKFTGEYPCRSAISTKLLCNFIEIALRQGCSPVNLVHIFRSPFPNNTPGWLLLKSYNAIIIWLHINLLVC